MACECISCDYCNGSGHIWRTIGGTVSRYRCDDLGDLEPCPNCRGGITETCYECQTATDDDWDH